MDDAHLTPAGLRKLLEESGDEERNRLLLHQLAVCPACYLVGGYLLDLYRAGAIDLRFNSLDADLAQSRADAPALLAKLTRFSFERQTALVRDLPRFRSWGLCELLCQESERLAPDDAALAVERAELAVAVASLLDEWQPAEALWLFELRALTWAHLGNAYRVQGILRRARAAFARAEEWWNKAAGNVGDAVGYQAKIFALKASFLTAERRLPEALAALEEATQAGPDPELAVAIGINRAKILGEQGDLDGAIALLRETEPAIDPGHAPRLYLCFRHNLVDYLSKAGRAAEAQALLSEVITLSESLGHELDRIRLEWTQGRVAARAGHEEDAIELLRGVREEFARRGIGYDCALVSIDLATVYARLGRTGEVQAIAREIVPLFAVQDVHREAIAALTVFVQAAERGSADEGLLKRVLAYLERARHNPGIVFDGSGNDLYG